MEKVKKYLFNLKLKTGLNDDDEYANNISIAGDTRKVSYSNSISTYIHIILVREIMGFFFFIIILSVMDNNPRI